MQAAAPADYQYHDSYFIVAHFHYVIVGGVVLALFAGTHFYWPKMFGTMLNENLGKMTFWLFFNWFPFNFLYSTFPWFNGNATTCVYIPCQIKALKQQT